MEITIKEKTYPLKASFAFLRKINKCYQTSKDGFDIDAGLIMTVTKMMEMGDMTALVDLIMALNTGQKPELKQSALEAYLEEDCEDIDSLIDEVVDFLSKANVCKKPMQMMGLAETEEKNEEKILA